MKLKMRSEIEKCFYLLRRRGFYRCLCAFIKTLGTDRVYGLFVDTGFCGKMKAKKRIALKKSVLKFSCIQVNKNL